MENRINIGKVSNTHGIKGEIRILSNFELKDQVFTKGFKLYINNEELIIETYRPHKEYDMVTLAGYKDINDVLKFKGKQVYINREDIKIESYIIEDLIGLSVYENNELLGKVSEIVYNSSNILLSISGNKNFYIPNNNNFIKSVDLENKKITVENAKGLIM